MFETDDESRDGITDLPTVRVETVDLDSRGARQIGARPRASAALSERSEDVRAAIVQASEIAQRSVAEVPRRDGWSVSTMEITFGLTLAAEAGVILSKASAEASFEITLTVERDTGRSGDAPSGPPPPDAAT
ncbi:CU044_2847 family protein [Streptomyces sp. NPDC048172]|uniref:CU044_2847 family protein n=1 Tax=Streptomyces sp. NPDC048172 TaxID=3365505 RepID=UPI0037174E72